MSKKNNCLLTQNEYTQAIEELVRVSDDLLKQYGFKRVSDDFIEQYLQDLDDDEES